METAIQSFTSVPFLAILLGAGGVLFGWYQQRQRAQMNDELDEADSNSAHADLIAHEGILLERQKEAASEIRRLAVEDHALGTKLQEVQEEYDKPIEDISIKEQIKLMRGMGYGVEVDDEEAI